jgi:hypothetical protein
MNKKIKLSGKYMYINAMFGPKLHFADTLKGLKLSKYDKADIKTGQAALFISINNEIVRINHDEYD